MRILSRERGVVGRGELCRVYRVDSMRTYLPLRPLTGLSLFGGFTLGWLIANAAHGEFRDIWYVLALAVMVNAALGWLVYPMFRPARAEYKDLQHQSDFSAKLWVIVWYLVGLAPKVIQLILDLPRWTR